MFWLLACTPPPPPMLDLPVSVPTAVNGTAISADEFVGPLDVAGLDAAQLCGDPDRAALLAAGSFGWRVLVVGPDGVRVAGDPVRGPTEATYQHLDERLERWAAADKLASERCGVAVSAPVLLAVDGKSPFETSVLHKARGLTTFDVRLLVADPEPGPAVPPPAQRAGGYSLYLAPGTSTWLLMSNDESVRASEHPNATEAIQRVVTSGYPEVVLYADSAFSWSSTVEGMDALAGIGVVPTFGLLVGGEPPAPVAVAPGSTRISLWQTVAVLPFTTPRQVGKSGTTHLP